MKTAYTRLLRTLATAACCASACTSSSGSKADAGGTGGAPGNDASSGIGPGQVASRVVNNGLVTTGPWNGYGLSLVTDPGAATIYARRCSGSAGCGKRRSRATRSACRGRSPVGRTTAVSAMLGWNVNQVDGGTMGTWLSIPATGGITVTVSNPGNTPLRLQLQGTDPHSATDRWCIPLTSGQLAPWTSFVTNCYTGGTPQTALTAGTPIQQASILVPGLQTDLPFSLCLVDVEITP